MKTSLDFVLRISLKRKCGIYRKKATADMYILPSSAHSDKLKQGILKDEFLRFITLSSTEKEYDEEWNRYDKALQTRGCKKLLRIEFNENEFNVFSRMKVLLLY